MGSVAGRDPVATMAWSKVSVCVPPPTSSTSSVCASAKLPRPRTKVTLRNFATEPTPPVSLRTTESFQSRSLSMSTVGLPKSTPIARAASASWSSVATWSSALDGMQPR